MKKIIKIKFVDFWIGFNENDNFFINLFAKYFKIEFSNNPDYIIYSCFGFEHLKYSSYRIYYCGENLRVNWNACDFALSSDYINSKNYFRLPHWVLYYYGLMNQSKKQDCILEKKKGFCSFIVGNSNAKKRIDFFYKLSKYKKVDSGGSFMNNIGRIYFQKDKMEFVEQYKFTIAFENSSYPGYTTEKIFQSILGNSIPIYWGDPLVGNDFNVKRFINYHDFEHEDALIQKIIEIDSNENLYTKMMTESWFPNNKLPDCAKEENIIAFFEKIFSSYGQNKPVARTYKQKLYWLQVKWKIADFYLNKYLRYKNSFR